MTYNQPLFNVIKNTSSIIRFISATDFASTLDEGYVLEAKLPVTKETENNAGINAAHITKKQ